jgi:hypothetical protein
MSHRDKTHHNTLIGNTHHGTHRSWHTHIMETIHQRTHPSKHAHHRTDISLNTHITEHTHHRTHWYRTHSVIGKPHFGAHLWKANELNNLDDLSIDLSFGRKSSWKTFYGILKPLDDSVLEWPLLLQTFQFKWHCLRQNQRASHFNKRNQDLN